MNNQNTQTSVYAQKVDLLLRLHSLVAIALGDRVGQHLVDLHFGCDFLRSHNLSCRNSSANNYAGVRLCDASRGVRLSELESNGGHLLVTGAQRVFCGRLVRLCLQVR